MSALGFTKTEYEEPTRDKFGTKTTFPAERDIEFGSDIKSGSLFGVHNSKESAEPDLDSREYNNKSPEDSGFGDERLERLSSPKARDDPKLWSFDIKPEHDDVFSPSAGQKTFAENYSNDKSLDSPPERDTDYLQQTSTSVTTTKSFKDDNATSPKVEVFTDTKEITPERIHRSPPRRSREENSPERKITPDVSALQQSAPPFTVKRISRVAGPREFLGNQNSSQNSASTQEVQSSESDDQRLHEQKVRSWVQFCCSGS